MIVTVPEEGTGVATVLIRLFDESVTGMPEVCASPNTLPFVATEADGSQRFELRRQFPEGSYSVDCTVTRSGVGQRSTTCSGELNAQDLIVAFIAPIGSVPPVLNVRLCFQPLGA
jgi:hypothetical protein